MRIYLRIMAPLALAYIAGAMDAYWGGVGILFIAQCAAIWMWGKE